MSMSLRFGYGIVGFAIGFLLFLQFLWSLPDGKLHITFCSVGQGDATYVRFPDGRDMLVDAGPGDSVLACLGSAMPFWDHALDLVVVSHDEKDHIGGMASVLNRYKVGTVVTSGITKQSEVSAAVFSLIQKERIHTVNVHTGSTVKIGESTLLVTAPDGTTSPSVLGATTSENAYGVVFLLRYQSVDVAFFGDSTATSTVTGLADSRIEVLKVPHHGSKTGFENGIISRLNPLYSIISVGKNSYGHPDQSVIAALANAGSRVLRTDQDGAVSCVSDGITVRCVPAKGQKEQ